MTQTRHEHDAPERPPAPGGVRLRGAEGDVVAHVEEVGSGIPVVFLHGLVGLNEHWEDVVSQLKRVARCVMIELPLLDLTGDDCSIHGVEALTVQLLESHVREPAVIVGNSFGGHVALRLALDHPRLVRALVLAGSSGLIEKSMVKEIQIHPQRDWLAERIGELFYDRSKLNEADIDRAHAALTRKQAARAMVRLSKSSRRDPVADQLAGISVPTLLLWGRDDIITPTEAAHMLHERIRASRLVWFDRCGHAPMVETPREFSAAMESFVIDLASRPAPR